MGQEPDAHFSPPPQSRKDIKELKEIGIIGGQNGIIDRSDRNDIQTEDKGSPGGWSSEQKTAFVLVLCSK